MIVAKLVVGAALLAPWIWCMSCATASVLDHRAEPETGEARDQVAPGKSHLLLTGIEEHDGRRTFHLILADYLVGRPVGQGMPFTLTEMHGTGVATTPLEERRQLQPVPADASPIELIRVLDAAEAERRLPPPSDVPTAVAVHPVVNRSLVDVEFWYRDRDGTLRPGSVAIQPILPTHTPFGEHLYALNLVWSVPVDVVMIGGLVIVLPFIALAAH